MLEAKKRRRKRECDRLTIELRAAQSAADRGSKYHQMRLAKLLLEMQQKGYHA